MAPSRPDILSVVAGAFWIVLALACVVRVAPLFDKHCQRRSIQWREAGSAFAWGFGIYSMLQLLVWIVGPVAREWHWWLFAPSLIASVILPAALAREAIGIRFFSALAAAASVQLLMMGLVMLVVSVI